jgi:hypothetical protein
MTRQPNTNSTARRIEGFLRRAGSATIAEICSGTGISRRAVAHNVSNLLSRRRVEFKRFGERNGKVGPLPAAYGLSPKVPKPIAKREAVAEQQVAA